MAERADEYALADRRTSATLALLLPPLQIAERHWRAEERGHQHGKVLAFCSLASWLPEDLSQTFSAARQALRLLREDEAQSRGVSLILGDVAPLVRPRGATHDPACHFRRAVSKPRSKAVATVAARSLTSSLV